MVSSQMQDFPFHSELLLRMFFLFVWFFSVFSPHQRSTRSVFVPGRDLGRAYRSTLKVSIQMPDFLFHLELLLRMFFGSFGFSRFSRLNEAYALNSCSRKKPRKGISTPGKSFHPDTGLSISFRIASVHVFWFVWFFAVFSPRRMSTCSIFVPGRDLGRAYRPR